MVHARRKLFELAAVSKAPIAAEAVRRIDRLFAVERDVAGLGAEARLTARRERSAPILADLGPWLRRQQDRLSRKSEVGKAIAYTTRRWEALTRFMVDGRICLTNNAAERALRGVAVGRRNWTFAGSDRGGERAAAIYTLVETAKLNGVDPQAWLADVLARLADHPAKRITDLLCRGTGTPPPEPGEPPPAASPPEVGELELLPHPAETVGSATGGSRAAEVITALRKRRRAARRRSPDPTAPAPGAGRVRGSRRDDPAGLGPRAEPVADGLRLGPGRERAGLDGVEGAPAGDLDRPGRPRLEAGQLGVALGQAPPLARDPGRGAHREEVGREAPGGRRSRRSCERHGGRFGRGGDRLGGAGRRRPVRGDRPLRRAGGRAGREPDRSGIVGRRRSGRAGHDGAAAVASAVVAGGGRSVGGDGDRVGRGSDVGGPRTGRKVGGPAVPLARDRPGGFLRRPEAGPRPGRGGRKGPRRTVRPASRSREGGGGDRRPRLVRPRGLVPHHRDAGGRGRAQRADRRRDREHDRTTAKLPLQLLDPGGQGADLAP